MTKILAFEGIDASGKTLQHELLYKRLSGKGFSVATKSFPEYDSFFGARIGELLGGEALRADEIDSKSMCLWFAMDRWQAFRDNGWAESDYLLINRYTLSNAVYQSIREIDSRDMLEWVTELEHGQLALPKPDAYIVLDVLPQNADKNMAGRGGREYTQSSRDVYETSQSIQIRAREKYIQYASELKNVLIIECIDNGDLLPPDDIHDKILKKLMQRGLV